MEGMHNPETALMHIHHKKIKSYHQLAIIIDSQNNINCRAIDINTLNPSLNKMKEHSFISITAKK